MAFRLLQEAECRKSAIKHKIINLLEEEVFKGKLTYSSVSAVDPESQAFNLNYDVKQELFDATKGDRMALGKMLVEENGEHFVLMKLKEDAKLQKEFEKSDELRALLGIGKNAGCTQNSKKKKKKTDNSDEVKNFPKTPHFMLETIPLKNRKEVLEH